MNHVQINLWIALVNTSKVRIFIINIEKSKIKHVLAMSLKCVTDNMDTLLYTQLCGSCDRWPSGERL